MSLVRDTVRGALWTILAGVGSRAFGLVGTLIVTHYVSPGDYGEVAVAAVLVMTASQLSTVGLGQYLVSKPDAPPSAAFVANLIHVSFGVVALGTLLVLGQRLAPALDAPGMTRFLAGLCFAALLERASFVPERLLARDLRFGSIGVIRTVADVAHTTTCIALAMGGLGAAALVWGNVVRAALRLVLAGGAVGGRAFLTPRRPEPGLMRELFGFALPIALGSLAGFASRRWDNLLVSRFFGPAVTGTYNLAYNLADVPAIHVGEQIGDVLLPSFARLNQERRPAALVRALGLLALLVFPMAIGLGVVAPTLVSVLFDPLWQPVAPMLVVLSLLSMTRPVSWVVASYVQALGRTLPLMWLELAKLALLVTGLIGFGRASPLTTCAVVVVAYAVHALASLALVAKLDRVPLLGSLGSLAPAAASSLPLVAAVLAVRSALGAPSALSLCAEIAAGALVYAASARLFARGAVRDLLGRLREALAREP